MSRFPCVISRDEIRFIYSRCGSTLTQHGVAAVRMTAKGYGKTQPVADNNRDEGRMKNRRVEIADPKCKPTAK
jgi:hypothetical protein